MIWNFSPIKCFKTALRDLSPIRLSKKSIRLLAKLIKKDKNYFKVIMKIFWSSYE